MRTYYTGEDIEDLAASGIRRLEIRPGVALTDIARELANQYGIELVNVNATNPTRPANPAFRISPIRSGAGTVGSNASGAPRRNRRS